MDVEWNVVNTADDADIVRLNPLIKTDHGFDVRVVAIGNDDEIKVLSRDNIIMLKGLFLNNFISIIYFFFLNFFFFLMNLNFISYLYFRRST